MSVEAATALRRPSAPSPFAFLGRGSALRPVSHAAPAAHLIPRE